MKTNLLRYIGSACCFLVLLSGCTTPVNHKESNTTTWEKLGPGGGGAVFIPTFSFEDPEKFVLRCDMTGSYLTNDGGNSYQQVNFAGGASCYAFDPNEPNTIYIGTALLNKSTDGGKTWEPFFPKRTEIIREIYQGDHADYGIETTNSLYAGEFGRIGAIRVDNERSGTVYFSMGPFFYYTFDAGHNWNREDLHQDIEKIYTDNKAVKGEVCIFTAGSAYVFNKASRTFLKKDFPIQMSPAFSITCGTSAQSGKVIFYALHHDANEPVQGEFGHSEVWRSDDQGVTWKQLMHPAITNTTTGIKPSYSMISCAEQDAGQVYLICNRYEERKSDHEFRYWYGALKTKDEGNSWKWVWKGGGGSGQYAVKDGIGVANLKDAWAEKAFGGEYIRLMDVGVYPGDGNIAIVTDWYRTMKTMDGGETWTEIYSKEQPDGTYISRGLDVTTAYGVHFDPFDSNHIAISYTDIGYHHSYDGGKSWIRSTQGVPSDWINTCYWMVFDPEIKDKIWSVWSQMHDFPRGKMTRNPAWKEYAEGGVCISTDGGRIWKPSHEGMGMNSPATSIVIDPASAQGNRTLYASVYNKGVFKSTDDGKTWELKNKGIEDNTCAFELTLTGNGSLFLTVSAAPMHKDGKRGREYYSGAVYRSTDGADSWTRLKVVGGPLFPNGIDFDRQNPDRIYLACWADISLSDLVGRDGLGDHDGNELIEMPGGIFLSEDNGTTWKQIFDDNQYVYDVTVDPYHPGRLYCNTFNQAAYRSDDGGKTWKKIRGYDFHWGQRIVVDQHDPEQVYITTFGSSVWHGIPVTVDPETRRIQ